MVSITKSTDITLHIILATLTKTLLKRKHFGSYFHTSFSENAYLSTAM